MKRTRRVFDAEYRRQAVAMTSGGRTVASVAQELGVSPELIYRWRKEAALQVASGEKSHKDLEAEIRQLRKRAERAEMEVAILKKAALIFGNSQRKD